VRAGSGWRIRKGKRRPAGAPGTLAYVSITNPYSLAYLAAADSALALLEQPNVGSRWTQPSALPDFTVGGLAGHLARQFLSVTEALAGPAGSADPIPLAEHYQRAAWNNSGLDGEANTAIRLGGERAAGEGPQGAAAGARRALETIRAELAGSGAGRPASVPMPGWSLSWDDFLLGRTMELLVHTDDLAVSVGIEPPQPAGALVIELLTRVAVNRHGPVAVLRALSRTERAPGTISAF
jgi:Mycothiol maleylpyruvate isomerase N-terminal domain